MIYGFESFVTFRAFSHSEPSVCEFLELVFGFDVAHQSRDLRAVSGPGPKFFGAGRAFHW
jgi:hypothetical protein